MAEKEKNIKSTRKRLIFWISIGAVIVAILALYLFDYGRSKTYLISVESLNPQVAVAGDSKGVEIEVSLTDKKGNPVSGHNLFAMADGNGRFMAYRLTTDEGGKAVFKFYVGASTIFTPAENIDITIYDESNSVFFLVSAKHMFTLTVVEEE